MKKIFLVLLAFAVVYSGSAQVLKRLADRAKQKMERKAGDKVDQAIDESVDGATKKKTDAGEEKTKGESDETKTKSETGASSGTLKSYSRYDFVPGDKILYTDDFAQEAIGEFPAKWNTNGGGEVVTLDGFNGKWLKLEKTVKYESSLKGNLPENYTVEFDLVAEYSEQHSVPWLYVRLNSAVLPGHVYGGKVEFIIGVNSGSSQHPDGYMYESLTKDGDRLLTATKKEMSIISSANHKKKPVHVAMWVQKDRFRAWVNDEKIYDFPKGAPGNAVMNKLEFEVMSGADDFKYLITNIKVAAALPDTRNKLITEGKWSTTGILFDVNSDKIKPESYGTLKQIAGVLSENADVKVKIIGHTDSDGKDDANLELSKKRAAAVKQALVTEFAIDEGRIQTDGMGESKPVADNGTSEGKAQNRRVEFIKI